MRKLVSVQRVVDLHPIPGADVIEVATVLGWRVVVKKNEFAVGDLCAYFEIDSLLPLRPEFSFLKDSDIKEVDVNGELIRGYRLHTVKLRGQISQGLCLHLDAVLGPVGWTDDAIAALAEGDDITDTLGVVKWDRPLPMGGSPEGPFPWYIPKTDQTRIQSAPEVLAVWADESVAVTEKLDGSSCTIYFDADDAMHVCSHELCWLPESDNVFWKAARALNLDPAKLTGLALQGEVVGGKVQGNRYNVGTRFYAFDIYDYDIGWYLDFAEFESLCLELGVPYVPVLEHERRLLQSVDEWVAYATRRSALNPGIWAEGVVVRSRTERREDALGGRLSFKCINPEFLLKEG
jgi:RNA ligase (TIGR02306 family)